MVSPYLMQPLRTLAQAQSEREICVASRRMQHLRRFGIKPVQMISTSPRPVVTSGTKWSDALRAVLVAKNAELKP